MGPTVGILILNHNGKSWLPGLYRSLLADPYGEKQIYLIDNHSDDGSHEMTAADYPQVEVLRLSDNFGYSAAYNICVPLVLADGCDYVIWSNTDIIIQPGCIGELVRIAGTDPQIGVVGPALLAWDSDEPNDFIKGNYPNVIPAMEARFRDPIDVGWVEGSFPLVSKQCVESIGGLDPYLHLGWEDADFCRRARYHGWRVVLAPAARAHHYGSGSGRGNAENATYLMRCKRSASYLYKLTDPTYSFARNLLNAIHLFIVHVKSSLCGLQHSAAWETSTFLEVICAWRIPYSKWKRDKDGKQPPQLRNGMQPIDIRITQREGNLHAPAPGFNEPARTFSVHNT